MVTAVDSRSSGAGSSPGRGHCVAFLGKKHYSHSIVPLSTQVYKWVPANLMLGATLWWTSISSGEGGSINNPSRFIPQNRDKLQTDWPLGSTQTLLWPWSNRSWSIFDIRNALFAFQDHVNSNCEYAEILCMNDCGAKFQKRFLQKHLDKDCPKKIIACPYCDDRHLREDKKVKKLEQIRSH